MDNDAQSLVEEATLDFALGDADAALEKLAKAAEIDPKSFDVWHTRAEVLFQSRRFLEALEAGKKALEIRPDDIHSHITLSRICMECGDKATAEHHGAQARMISWKSELKKPEESAQ